MNRGAFSPPTSVRSSALLLALTLAGVGVAAGAGNSTGSAPAAAAVFDVTAAGAVSDGSADCSTAVQAVLERAAHAPAAVLYFPPGMYRFDHRVSVTVPADAPLRLTIRGEGPGVTRLESNNGEGVLRMALGGHPNTITVRDLSFVTARAGAGTALEIRGPDGGNMHSRELVAENVEILTLDPRAGYFNNGIVAVGLWRPLFNNVSFAGPWGREPASDFSDASALWRADAAFVVDDSYAPVFRDCYAWSAKVGYRFCTDKNPGPEDGAWFRSFAVATRIGIDYSSPSLKGGEPSLWIRDSHFNCRDVGLRIRGKRFLYVSGCLFYNEDGLEGIPAKLQQPSRAQPHPYVDVELTGVQWASIRDCVFHYPSNPRRMGVRLEQCSRVKIEDNAFNIRGVGVVEVGANPQITVANNTVSEFNGAFVLRQRQ